MKNNSRKHTPDLLSELMSGETNNTASEQDNNKAMRTASKEDIKKDSKDPIKQDRNKAVQPASNTAMYRASNKAVKHVSKVEDSNKASYTESKKATFNLTQQQLDELEDCWLLIKRQLKGGGRITKTLIVEKALEIALEDYEKNGNKSKLYKAME